MTAPRHVFRQESAVSREERERQFKQKGCVVWFTGLPGSGKSTIARAVERALADRGHAAYLLDGDNIRHGLNSDLGFSDRDRDENIRRVGEVAALFADAGLICLAAFVSPFRAARARARKVAGKDRFLEIHVAAPVEVCEQRDPKGLYGKAKKGEVSEFTGVSSPYEPPEHPDLVLDTARDPVEKTAAAVLRLLKEKGIVSS